MSRDKLTLYASSLKAARVIDAIHERHPGIISQVVTERNRSVLDDGFESMVQACKAAGIPMTQSKQAAANPTPFAMAIGWRRLINTEAKLIVLHDSLLPRYRGFNPLVSMLINGERVLGVTALHASEEYDRGPVIGTRSVGIEYPITIARATELVTQCYVQLSLDILQTISSGEPLPSTPQCENHATYSLWRDEDDYWIDWTADAEHICRMVDAVGPPYLGARTHTGAATAIVHRAEPLADLSIENRTPGKIVFLKDGLPTVVCGRGLVRILKMSELGTGQELLPWTRFRTRFSRPTSSGTSA